MRNSISISFPVVAFILILAMAIWSEININRASSSHVATASKGSFVDPVCQMQVGTSISLESDGEQYFFCSERCQTMFEHDPDHYLSSVCLVCKSEGTFTPLGDSSEFVSTWQATEYAFCTVEHREVFVNDPAGYFLHTMWGIPNWLYYSSIAFILILSFGMFEINRKQDSTETPPRLNLFHLPGARRFFEHPLSRFSFRLFFVLFFVLIIAAGLFGSQISSDNITPLLTWTI